MTRVYTIRIEKSSLSRENRGFSDRPVKPEKTSLMVYRKNLIKTIFLRLENT